MQLTRWVTSAILVASLVSCAKPKSAEPTDSNEQSIRSYRNTELRTQSWRPDNEHVCVAEGPIGATKATQIKLLTKGGGVRPSAILNAYNLEVTKREKPAENVGVVAGIAAASTVAVGCFMVGLPSAFGVIPCMIIGAPLGGGSVGMKISDVAKKINGAQKMRDEAPLMIKNLVLPEHYVVAERSYRAWQQAALESQGNSSVRCELSDAQVIELFK
jgi:hypothetical protein